MMATALDLADSNELPVGWHWRTLRSLTAGFFSGKRPKGGVANIKEGALSLGGEHLTWSGTVDLTTPRRIPEAFADAMGDSELVPRDILIVKDGATTGKTAFVHDLPERAFVNEHVFVLRPTEEILPEYLFYWLWSRPGFEQIMLDFRGAAQGGIGRTFVDKVAVPWAPVPTQHRIVSRITDLFSELEGGEEELRRARAELGMYRKSLLKAAVTGELTADWRAANPPKETGSDLLARILADRRARWEAEPKNKGKRYKEPPGLEESNLPKLPRGWAWASLGQLVSEVERSFQSGPFGSELRHSEFALTGKLVIGIDNVRNGFFTRGSDNRISEEKYERLKRFRARPEDVLITVMATIGRTCVVPKNIEEAIITKHVYRMTINSCAASPFFVEAALRGHPCTLTHIFGKVQGQTRPGLNKGILEKTPIPFCPLYEQQQAMVIAEELMNAHTELKHTVEQAKVSTLRQSILAAAFRGELVQ